MFKIGDSVQLFNVVSKKAPIIKSGVGIVIETGKLRGREFVKCTFSNHCDEFTKRNDGVYRSIGYSAACCDIIKHVVC